MKLAALTDTSEAAAAQMQSGSLQTAKNYQLISSYIEIKICLLNIIAFGGRTSLKADFLVYVFI